MPRCVLLVDDGVLLLELVGSISDGCHRAALNSVITGQATIIAYIDGYKLLMIATLAVLPLRFVFKRPTAGGRQGGTMVVE